LYRHGARRRPEASWLPAADMFRHSSRVMIRRSGGTHVLQRTAPKSCSRTIRRLAEAHRSRAIRCLAVSTFQRLQTLPTGVPVPPMEMTPVEDDEDGM
jgi:hypothetical protein